jgi:hypothetical protein
MITINKPTWADFYQGPVINVGYKNTMNPGQTEGALLFDFNGFVEKVSSAKRKRNGLT